MLFASNAHTHCTHCDGKNTMTEMLGQARSLGFVSLGFSSHAAQGFDTSFCMLDHEQRAYFQEARALQQREKQLRVWVGLELDALAYEAETADALAHTDYILASTHYLFPAPDGSHVAVDGLAQRLKEHLDTCFGGDGLAMAREYYQIESDFIRRVRPQIIGHFDLIRKHAAGIGLFDEKDPAYRRIALDALERCFSGCRVLEVNTGGMARGYLPTPYPTLELLCAWREMGGAVTITSDCHDLRLLNYGFDAAAELIRKAGFGSVLRLGAGERLWDEVPL